jgi:hypothetical protein
MILYAEYDNMSELIFYAIEGNVVMRYETYFFVDKELYREIREDFVWQSNHDSTSIKEALFEYYYRPFSRRIFINSSFYVSKTNDCLVFERAKKTYKIKSSSNIDYNRILEGLKLSSRIS